MKDSKLTPGVSTHFRWIGLTGNVMTTGKIYRILKWREKDYHFIDDRGGESVWLGQNKVEDASYEINLEKILE